MLFVVEFDKYVSNKFDSQVGKNCLNHVEIKWNETKLIIWTLADRQNYSW